MYSISKCIGLPVFFGSRGPRFRRAPLESGRSLRDDFSVEVLGQQVDYEKTHTHNHTHTHIYIYIQLYTYCFVSVRFIS